MSRIVIEPELANYESSVSSKIHGLETEIVPWLLFRGEYHFEAMDHEYANGYRKEGTIRYKSGKVCLPLSNRIYAFESSEFRDGKSPRGYILLDKVVVSPLSELTDEEIMKDGFDDKEDMLWQMTKMKGRYYRDLTPESIVSYFSFLLGLRSLSCDNLYDRLLPSYMLMQQRGERLEYWNQLKKKDKTGWTNF